MSAIVIEGCDGTGKTTLAREIEKQQGYEYRHLGVPAPDEDLFETYLTHLIDARDKNIVFDRLHIGELPYGSVMRGKSKLTLYQLRLLNRVLHAGGGITVFCQPIFDAALSNWNHRQKSEYVDGAIKLARIHSHYGNLIEGWGNLPHIIWDYMREKPEELIERLGKAAWGRPLPHGVNGVRTARFMFVGEQPGGERDISFCSMQNSSGWLNKCLWDAGYDEHQLAFTNAYDGDGGEHSLYEYYDSFEWYPHVVALGNIALEQCEAHGIPGLILHHLPHPQYWKRFKSKKRYQYVKKLRSIREQYQ